ncbi:hypothetical protein AXG93_700s1120 [Marchantia polymorpha subsp. ruderalis]|uniref:Bet v I/Major latex protein domain-containing protein n=1 Tax=Marchantia polymorpha subsp. ruderalis TaxID=1480154 RepID=A0A176WNK4_MARPO|nr:hypothetical protein AXG93_700s1120 [Marchantia polymorpha subsp. ruderalis]
MYTLGPVEVELNVSAYRLWAAVKDMESLLPRVMPVLRASVEIEGDGGAGSIRYIKFPAETSVTYDSRERLMEPERPEQDRAECCQVLAQRCHALRDSKFWDVSTKIFSIERIDVMDDDTYTEVHTLIGGEIDRQYSFYRSTKTFTPVDIGLTVATWFVEYEPLDDSSAPEYPKQMFLAFIKAIEAYLVSHDDYA